MSINRELAAVVEQMGELLELLGANRFRVVAYQRGARAIRDAADDLAELADDPNTLTDIEGIGKGLAEKIVEYVETGRIAEHQELLDQVPAGLLEVMKLPGIGPKTAALFWKQAGVASVDDLKAKLETGELEQLPRIGVKTLENIRHAIAFAEAAGERRRLGDVLPVAMHFVHELGKRKDVKKIDYAGSLRRGQETIGDVDLLVASEAPDEVAEAFGEMDLVRERLAAGSTKISLRTEDHLQVDLRIVRPDRYGAALVYFTGSKEHNVQLRQRAIDRKRRLNEYGLWAAADAENMDEAEPVAAETEEDVYQALGLPFIPPALRESRGEIAAAERGELPELIERSDIRCELHAHTTASDGTMSMEELVGMAKDRDFHTIAVTDHSVSSVQANGLSVERLEKQIEQVRALNGRMKGITILAGAEVDILADGRLDYPDHLLKELDIVVASPHAALKQEPAKATKRLRKAIDNPYVHIIGHPTGRLITRRQGLNPDLKDLLAAAAETNTAMELNANPWRLDLRDTHLRMAVDMGVMIAINTDAHHAADFDLLAYGVLTARRGWVERQHVVNCLTAAGLKDYLRAKRKKMG